jgi:protein-S-isoprenylcysteine O-methyltransferase Ste14
LLYRSWIALIVVVPLVVVLLVRIRDEERVLHEAFGTEWETYCQRSWKLLPFIY